MKEDFFKRLKDKLKTAKAITEFCQKYQAEFLENGNKYLVLVPRKLDETSEEELRGLIPDGKPIAFHEGPKINTQTVIQGLIANAQPKAAEVKPDLDNRTVTIVMDGVNESHPVWGSLSDILKKDGFFESWKFVSDGQENEVLANVVKEVAKNKTGRDKVIADDDITNLKISLGNAQTVDDILKAIGG